MKIRYLLFLAFNKIMYNGRGRMSQKKQGKLKLKKFRFKAKNGYYPIHKKSFKRWGKKNYHIKEYNMGNCIKHIKDENTLLDIALNHVRTSNRLDAVKNHNFRNEKKLLKLINECNGYEIRSTAVSKIKKEENLINLVKNHHDWHVRCEALRNDYLRNKKTIEKAALHDKDYMVRMEAVKHVDNQDVLVFLSRNDENVLVRSYCVKQVRNMDILVYVAKHDVNWRVRKAAIEEIKDKKILETLLNYEEDDYCRDLIEKMIEYLKMGGT